MRYADRIEDRKPVFSRPALNPASRFLTAEPYRNVLYTIAPRIFGYNLYCNYELIYAGKTADVQECIDKAIEHFETLKPTIR
jgi:hypothetical protein